MDDFINRVTEISDLDSIISIDSKNSPKLIIYNTLPASGISYYFKHLTNKLRNRNKEYVVFYIDGNMNLVNTIYSQYLNQINVNYSEHIDFFQKLFIRNKSKIDKVDLFAAALEGIPFAGSFLREIIDQNSEEKEKKSSLFRGTDYSSLSAEIFSKSLKYLNRKFKIIFFIDNIQELDNLSFGLLKSTIGGDFKNLNYIVSYTNNVLSNQADCLSKKYPFTSVYEKFVRSFKRPNEHFIHEYAKIKGKEITYPKAKSILMETEGQIYEIYRCINDFKLLNTSNMFSKNQLEIINLIRIVNQPIRVSDILKIINRSKENFSLDSDSTKKTIEELVEFKVLESYSGFSSDLLILIKNSESIVLPKITIADRIRITENIYKYFSLIRNSTLHHSKSEIYPLLYRLSKEVRKEQSTEIALELIKISFASGAEDFVNDYLKDINSNIIESYTDFLIVAAYLFNSKKYRDLNIFINNTQKAKWYNRRVVKVLRAITLNRIRRHKDSERIIFELLKEPCSKEEEVSLIIYLISGLLHQNNVALANQIYTSKKGKLSKANNFGYLMRNGSSTLSSEEAIKELKKARKVFLKTEDRFGESTVLNNLGINHHRLGNYNNARESFEKALNIMEGFGTIHLSLLLNNLGIYYLFCGEYEKSMHSFIQAENFTKASMPLMFITINKALLFFVIKRSEEALYLLDSIENTVEEYEVDRVRQKYYINKLIISALIDSNNLSTTIKLVKKYPLRENPKKTFEKINKIKKGINPSEFLSFVEPCYLAYWYHNPLKYFNLKSAS